MNVFVLSYAEDVMNKIPKASKDLENTIPTNVAVQGMVAPKVGSTRELCRPTTTAMAPVW